MDGRLARGRHVPRAGPVEITVAKDDAIETAGRGNRFFQRHDAVDQHAARRCRIERRALGMRLAARGISKGNALRDDAPRTAPLGSRNKIGVP